VGAMKMSPGAKAWPGPRVRDHSRAKWVRWLRARDLNQRAKDSRFRVLGLKVAFDSPFTDHSPGVEWCVDRGAAATGATVTNVLAEEPSVSTISAEGNVGLTRFVAVSTTHQRILALAHEHIDSLLCGCWKNRKPGLYSLPPKGGA